VILHSSEEQLKVWKRKIEEFLNKELSLELHHEKSKIISLSQGVDFVGFRNFYHFKLLRKRNIRNMERKIDLFHKGEISGEKMKKISQGWNAYAKWADSYRLRLNLFREIFDYLK